MTKLWIVGCIVVALGCKKDDATPADPAVAPAPVPAPAPSPAPEPNEADCKSTKEFTTVAACVALCDTAGNANACYVAGSSYHVGDKTDEDEAKALEYFTKGCDKGSPEGCEWGGSMHRNGDGGVAASMD